MSKKRKTYSPTEKAKIVLEVLREESTLNEIATNYGVSPQLIRRWKVEFIENMPAVFDKKKTEIEEIKKEHSVEKADLIYTYLLRNVPITHVNQVWGIDYSVMPPLVKTRF